MLHERFADEDGAGPALRHARDIGGRMDAALGDEQSWGLGSGVWGLAISQREPDERKVRNGFAATKEYRACGESNPALRNSTRQPTPSSRSMSDSGVCVVMIS